MRAFAALGIGVALGALTWVVLSRSRSWRRVALLAGLALSVLSSSGVAYAEVQYSEAVVGGCFYGQHWLSAGGNGQYISSSGRDFWTDPGGNCDWNRPYAHSANSMWVRQDLFRYNGSWWDNCNAGPWVGNPEGWSSVNTWWEPSSAPCGAGYYWSQMGLYLRDNAQGVIGAQSWVWWN